MKIVFAAALLVLACACESRTKGTPDYRPEEAGTVGHALCLLGFTGIPLRRTTGTGHHLVEATINGRRGTFVLDTGANMSVIDQGQAATFGLSGEAARPGGAIGVSGRQQAQQVRIGSLRIGPVPIRQRRLVLTDLGHISDMLAPQAGGAVHGLVGQDVLNEHRAVIDVSRAILYLIEEDEAPAPVPAEQCRAAGRGGEAPASSSE